MSGRIRHCKADSTYTLSRKCPMCGKDTSISHPARFSPYDRLTKYHRGVRSSTTSV